jgi:hypothetical protein
LVFAHVAGGSAPATVAAFVAVLPLEGRGYQDQYSGRGWLGGAAVQLVNLRPATS